MGLCSGVRNSFLAPLPKLFDNGNAPESATRSSNPVSVHPMPVDDMKPLEEDNDPSRGIGSSNVSGSSQLKDQNNQPNVNDSTSSKEQNNQPTAEQKVKRRKQHRRRRIHNQEQCAMRGVYFKNMKWQAAIKVDKKQIHLGTVSSPEEAAHLYDRAAFMCGREPNFELPKEEKEELRRFKWDEFLTMTRRAITCKKSRKRHGTGAAPASVLNSDWEGGSDDVEPDSSTSESLFIEPRSNSSFRSYFDP